MTGIQYISILLWFGSLQHFQTIHSAGKCGIIFSNYFLYIHAEKERVTLSALSAGIRVGVTPLLQYILRDTDGA
jgi:hypothetical protein